MLSLKIPFGAVSDIAWVVGKLCVLPEKLLYNQAPQDNLNPHSDNTEVHR